LGEEHLLLQIDVRLANPAVDTALADAGVGEAIEVGAQDIQPVVRAFGGVPRVEAEGGMDEVRESPGQFGHRGPVRLAGPVDDAAGDAGGAHGGDDGVGARGDAGVLEVEVGVEHGVSGSRIGGNSGGVRFDRSLPSPKFSNFGYDVGSGGGAAGKLPLIRASRDLPLGPR